MVIIPNEIPEDATPLETDELPAEQNVTGKWLELYHGKNMFVSLTTGKTYVGRVEVDGDHITVGLSNRIAISLVESSREV